MPTYSVQLSYLGGDSVTVEAADEDEAYELALEQVRGTAPDDGEWEVMNADLEPDA